MLWLQVALGADGGLAKAVKVGDRVRHCGTRQWGRVLEVRPQADGTAELRVEREVVHGFDIAGEGWWATYHIAEHEAGRGCADG